MELKYILIALLAHFAKEENLNQLQPWIKISIDNILYRLFVFFDNLSMEQTNDYRGLFDQYLDYWTAHYFGSLKDEQINNLAHKYKIEL